jgi:hypothetical protein
MLREYSNSRLITNLAIEIVDEVINLDLIAISCPSLRDLSLYDVDEYIGTLVQYIKLEDLHITTTTKLRTLPQLSSPLILPQR